MNSSSTAMTSVLREFPLLLRWMGPQFQCMDCNTAWLSFRDRTLEQELGNAWMEGMHPDDVQQYLGARQAAAKAHQSFFETEYRLFGAEGNYRYIKECSTAVRDEAGNVVSYLAICSDVSPYLLKANALEESVEVLREVTENSDQMIWLRDPHTRQFFYISPAYEKIWGRSCRSLYDDPLSWREAIHPQDKERILAVVARQDAHVVTYRIIRPDGTIRWVTTRVFPVRDRDGQVTRIAGIVADVTEQQQIEQALQESEERLRQIADNTDHVIWLQEADNPTLLYVNRAYEKISGRTVASLYSSPRSWQELIHPEDKERVLAAIQDTPAGESLVFRSLRDGAVRFITFRAFPIKDRNGRIIRIAGIASDVTKQRQIEEALRESERRFRELAENIEEVFWSWTREPYQLLYVSPAYERIWGRTCQSLYDNPFSWREAVHPEDRERVIRAVTGPPEARVDMNYRIVRPDGEIRWMRERIFPVPTGEGPPNRWTAVTDDITKSKKAQEALETANRRLRILSRRRVQVQEQERKFLAIELHDQMGQMLTAAKLALEGARRAKAKGEGKRQLDQTTDLIDQMVQQVRRISFDLRPPALDDLGLVPALRSLLTECAEKSDWVTEFREVENLPRPDDEVGTACFRIILEALTNVMRHAKATKVSIELQGNQDEFIVRVCDNGVGFDMPESEKRIQRDHLGLVGMSERASAVGGSFRCETKPGAGTQVTVLLPYHAA